MILKGKAHVVGNDVDTDVIIPGRFLTITDPKEVAKHIFEGVDPDFVKRVKPGDVIIAGKNFGSGSSREQAAIGLKALGISAVIAKSFARIFFRNAINVGLPIFISPEAVEYANNLIKGKEVIGSFVKSTDIEVEINVDNGEIKIMDKTFNSTPMPPFILDIMRSGGILEWAKSKLNE